ncbi:MAG: sigma-70 family RNA polymerase sigma factor [Phycisphaerae bacterium]|nr:sigma-70 family RNA polymerase sigma factor [Phycisphaerae bacterium]
MSDPVPFKSDPLTPPIEARDVTALLGAMRDGDAAAGERVLQLVYRELRDRASACFRNVRNDHTLQPTALVHEAYLRISSGDIAWKDRSHFLAVAAKAMRFVLADHARRRRSAKRGGGGDDAWERVTLCNIGSDGGDRIIDALDLEEALTELGEVNERLARIVELRFFAGLTVEEVAELLDLAPRTIELDWRTARAWLRNRLHERGE